MKKRMCFLLALMLAVSLITVVQAEPDMDYAGPIDNFTGEPVDETVTQIQSDRVLINSETTFDRTKRMFVYSGGTKEVFSSIATGLITTDPVEIQLPEGMVYTLFKDGNPVSDVDVSYISEPGAYVLSQSMSGGKNAEILRFTIVNSVTGELTSFRVPAGFILSTVTLDGENVEHDYYSVSLSEEGKYDINYRCPEAELVYHTTFAVDHTAPTLALPGVEDGVARGPVDISDLEPGASIGIWLNGESVPYANVLTGSGVYRIVVTDQAGNMSNYQFTIRVYFNNSALFLFLTLLLLLLSVGGYLLYSRMHLRVR